MTQNSAAAAAATAVTALSLATSQYNDNNDNGNIAGSIDSTTDSQPTSNGSLRALLGLLPTLSVSTTTTTTGITKPPLVIGHRGSLYQALENTRPSFQHCMDVGCDGIELDVFVIADGTLVVFHGNDRLGCRPGDLFEYCLLPSADHTTTTTSPPAGTTSIMDYTYQQCLQQLQFNPNFTEFTCPKECITSSRIPTLEEVLRDVQEHNNQRKHPKMTVKIELKGPNTVVPVLELVERLDMVDACCYSSFDLQQLLLLRQLRPSTDLYPTGALFAHLPDDYLQQAMAVGATEIHVRYDECTCRRIADIHQHGFGSMVWTRGPRGMHDDVTNKYYSDVGHEDDERLYQALIETGAQQLCVNRPDVLLQMIRQKQLQHLAASVVVVVNDEREGVERL